ncbi:MAG: extracellular solute-binding protein [Clostridia bacterium]|nr:extracellular solute-binding protein [Clostridia bacterium]
MNKKKLVALLVASTMVVGSAVAFAGCDNGDNPDNPNTPSGNATKITLWVSEMDGVVTMTKNQVNEFFEANTQYKGKYNVVVDGMSESEAATKMVTDVATGADIYCFAQDQLGRLVEAGALSELGPTAQTFVKNNNDGGAAKAATIDEKMYCYPITSDNGYFMYYDKTVIAAEHLNDLASIVADCEAAGKSFAYELGGSAWYTASFFFGAGCHSNWTYNSVTKKWTIDDDFNSDKGIIAMKGMQILTQSGVWVDSSKAAEFGDADVIENEDGSTTEIQGGAAVVVSGTWDSGTAKEKLGPNFAVTKLPEFKVGETSYQLSSYSGNKLMGVKPHEKAEDGAFCNALAQYLSGEKCQEARFDEFGWGPSNKAVQDMDKVKSDEVLAALNAQNEYATPQGEIGGAWWDIAKLLGTKSKDAKNDADLKTALDEYDTAIDNFTRLSEDAKNAFGVIGGIASLAGVTENLSETQTTWADWGTDYKMVKTEKDGKIIWKTAAPITLAEGEIFKVRQGQAWNVQFGAIDEETGLSQTGSNPPNYTVSADEAGAKYVVLTLTVDKDGKIVSGVITLEAE